MSSGRYLVYDTMCSPPPLSPLPFWKIPPIAPVSLDVGWILFCLQLDQSDKMFVVLCNSIIVKSVPRKLIFLKRKSLYPWNVAKFKGPLVNFLKASKFHGCRILSFYRIKMNKIRYEYIKRIPMRLDYNDVENNNNNTINLHTVSWRSKHGKNIP